jgi:ABC-type multidrug transport system fused ATPase/permease subunit
LLLDEATSALDEESQRKVQGALDKVMQGRTSIVVAHRLTTVEKCSRVAVIEDGQVIEEGSFNNLMGQEDGYFSKLAKGMKVQAKKESKAPKDN